MVSAGFGPGENMLLRRITKHVKDQNWFAVGLDFFIVVIGVFIGIQLGNLNDARSNAEGLRSTLERLQAEVAHNVQIADDLLSFIESGQADRELAKFAVSNCEESEEAVSALNRSFFNLTDDYQPDFMFVTLNRLSSHDEYQELLSPEFSDALGQYTFRLNEEQVQLASHYDNMWGAHVSKHPSVSANFAGPVADWNFYLSEPFSDVCRDTTFRNRFVHTLGFLDGIERRLMRFQSQISEFETALTRELETQ